METLNIINYPILRKVEYLKYYYFKLIITKWDMRLLQSGTTFRYYKVGSVLLQSGTAFLLQIETILLQSGTGITKWDSFITKRDRYYKVRRLLQCGL